MGLKLWIQFQNIIYQLIATLWLCFHILLYALIHYLLFISYVCFFCFFTASADLVYQWLPLVQFLPFQWLTPRQVAIVVLKVVFLFIIFLIVMVFWLFADDEFQAFRYIIDNNVSFVVGRFFEFQLVRYRPLRYIMCTRGSMPSLCWSVQIEMTLRQVIWCRYWLKQQISPV